MTSRRPLLSLFGALVLCSCNNADSMVAVPRPTAYPRVNLYDTVYSPVRGVPVYFEVNAATRGDVRDVDNIDVWLDLIYPDYGSTLYCSFTAVDAQTRKSVIDNRMERIVLNVGDNATEVTELQSSGGYITKLIYTPSGTVTPLQFLSEGDRWVVSGALYFNNAITSVDSILPLIDAVKTDIIHAAKYMK